MSNQQNNCKWNFIDDSGTFSWMEPEDTNELYFPLCNEAGIMSSITPVLHGDLKTGQHNFILLPVSVEDFHNTKSARNFWFYIHGKGPWSVSGNSAAQNSMKFTGNDDCERLVEAGLLWHKLTYRDKRMGVSSEILSFVPANEDKVEVMAVKLTNESGSEIKVTPTSCIPLFGRSAENIRDHRHVTSLVNRLERLQYGITLKPVIKFDERGHKMNDTTYYVLGSECDGTNPVGTFPVMHSFIGKGGSCDWPEAVVKNLDPESFKDESTDGKEYVGALRFGDAVLKAGESREYIIILGISSDRSEIDRIFDKYNTSEKVYKELQNNKDCWVEKAGRISFKAGQAEFANWMKWVSIQPVLRKIFGCSFLPYHDYGKGGRGWRDLWQDCLSLILLNPKEVRDLLINNFAGVRIDGSNATIIGTAPGEFIADRNNISRVWMDHGSWPYITTRLYMDQSGDMGILLEKRTYFRDAQLRRAGLKDENWTSEYGNSLKTADGTVYEGTVIEHILVQHLTCFFNVGEHNIIRLEGGDWNDTLDMARKRGESTAFTALYGSNLISISELLLKLKDELGIEKLEFLNEISILLDSVNDTPMYDSAEYKKSVLSKYFDEVCGCLSGKRTEIAIEVLAGDLREKGEWIYKHLSEKEWVETAEGDGFFNGYYNEDGQRVDGQQDDGVRMNLTAQVFTTMYGLASEEQVLKAYNSCMKYLKDPATGGYRLNTHLGSNQLNFGRCFSFAYGEKENGAVFCHMVVMYMNALYKRGFVNEAYEVFKSLYDLSIHAEVSGIYPGIPEYFSLKGKGMYHYLTGSASWLLLTVLNEMFGVKGEAGALSLQPKLTPEQFDGEGRAFAETTFGGRRITVEYINENRINYKDYRISCAEFNGKQIDNFIADSKTLKVPFAEFLKLSSEDKNTIKVYLG